jgi:2-keto-3-deoxy-L-rhamnonate aldolase RhmA
MAEGLSSLAEAVHAGRRTAGTFVKLPALEVIEIVAETLDFAVVDLEHSQLGEAEALALVRHARALDFPALVRLHELDRALVNRALEAGAAGIQLSSVRSAAEVRALRSAALYAPRGSRSISLAHRGARFGRTPLADYLGGLADPLLVVQIETAETDDPLETIAAAGADVVFVGVTDLTVELGLDRERTAARVDEIAAAAASARVALGGFGSDERFAYSIASSDLALLAQAYADA